MNNDTGYYTYATLFDKNYLAKGITTLDSLLAASGSARVYVLSMDGDCCHEVDDATYQVLKRRYQSGNDSEKPRVIPIRLTDFLDFYEELRQVKEERSRKEFCWSCSAFIIDYVLEAYSEEYCTYIDADMYFFSNPDILIEEMVSNGKSVQVIEHRFRPNRRSSRRFERLCGRFCVQFNTFKNDNDGRMVLDDWKGSIIRQCSLDMEKGLGDQFYLSEWPVKFDCVNILGNLGAGLAPWNIDRYRLVDRVGMTTDLSGKSRSLKAPIYVSFDNQGKHKVIFYHYHGMQYKDENTVDLAVFRRYFNVDKKLVYALYMPYIRELEHSKRIVENALDAAGIPQGPQRGSMVVYDHFRKRITLTRIINGTLYRLKLLKNRNGDFVDVNGLDEYIP